MGTIISHFKANLKTFLENNKTFQIRIIGKTCIIGRILRPPICICDNGGICEQLSFVNNEMLHDLHVLHG